MALIDFLNDTATLRIATITENSNHEPIKTWVTSIVPAILHRLHGSRYWVNGASGHTVVGEVYLMPTVVVNEADEITISGKTFTIEMVDNVQERDEFLRVSVSCPAVQS